MKILKGDIISLAESGEYDVLIHGCNCFCTMGAGVAKQVKKHFPGAYDQDLTTVKGDINKLGSITFTEVPLENEGSVTVVNAYTQYRYGRGVQLNYGAVGTCFNDIRTLFSGKKMIYPKIGAGLAGGDWSIISNIIDEELQGEDHTLVVL